MTVATGISDDAARPPADSFQQPADELCELKGQLERMTTYAQALEQRCNRLWIYVPDTHSLRDPVVPFVARHCNLPVRSGEAQSSKDA